MRIIPVPADGDCFYHAFIKGLGLEGLTPQLLRDIVARKVLTDQDLYDDLVKEWVDFNVINDKRCITPEAAAHHIKTTKEWSTSTIIHILATAFNVRVIVFQKINNSYFSEAFPSEWKQKPQGKPYKDIYILRRGYHYELLLPVDRSGSQQNGSYSRGSRRTSSRSRLVRQRGGGKMNDDIDDLEDPDHRWLTMTLGFTSFILFVLTF